MATMKFFNVLDVPSEGAVDGTYYVKNGDYIDTYLVSSGKVEKLSAQDDLALKANQTDLEQLESEVNLKEVKANKQNSLAVDGTGTKFPTVDAVNEGFGLKANKEQEEWITPTLINGATGTVKYRKNEFGVVEVIGLMSKNGANVCFVLPVGYRPEYTYGAVLPKNNSWQRFTYCYAAISSVGNFQAWNDEGEVIRIDMKFPTGVTI